MSDGRRILVGILISVIVIAFGIVSILLISPPIATASNSNCIPVGEGFEECHLSNGVVCIRDTFQDFPRGIACDFSGLH